MRNLIINADDFGISKEVSTAILAAMDLNICTDATLLVNFEDSRYAAELAIQQNRKDNIGIHLNLTEGHPLTAKIKNERRFCNTEGLFHYKKKEHIMILTKSEKSAVYEELTSQIYLCRAFGIPISHADSHNHIHEEPGLMCLMLDLMKKEKIPFLRQTNNLGATSLINRIYRNSYNRILRYHKLAGTDYFGSTTNLINYNKELKANSIIELMIHPGKIVDKQIFDAYSKDNLSLILPGIIRKDRLLTYSQLHRK
ncbi:MAG: ChbG/HpnK family deacetylase [Paludibacter sp.]|nr:ChbG/HpnK family deacetylase [Paludibacter sp.]